ncbi:transmembrane protein 18 [Planococcus citri]|uniref:transmembrane protein 18 n=1 Tax=Planococcus citri TaxID=170843 RepID=UPI0031F98B0A
MLDFQQIEAPDLNIYAFLQNVDWYDPWLVILILFHISITVITFATRNRNNFQVILFLFLLLLVYCSENINKVASDNWRLFSRQQYFDSNGFFISLVFCIPILLNCMLMVANWLYMSRELMTQLKIAQLKSQYYSKQNEALNTTKHSSRSKKD